jgi:hypothetical protein
MSRKEGDDYLKKLDEEMKNIPGSDRFTDAERRAIISGVSPDDKLAIDALGRKTEEIRREQNPHNLPLIFKRGNLIRVLRSNGKLEDDWRVDHYVEAGYVVVAKDDPSNPERQFEKKMLFKEFYALNPPDETCMNADRLEDYKRYS